MTTKARRGRPPSEENTEVVVLTVRVPPGTRARMEAAAARDKRFLANWAARVLERASRSRS